MRRLFLCILLVACCGLSLNGCGYHLSRPENSSAALGKTIAVPVFANRSFRPGLDAILTGSMVDEFAGRNGGRVVAEETAELVLSGAIVSYSTTAVSFTKDDKIREYRAAMTIDATLREKESRRVLWRGEETMSQDYPANANVALQQNSEDAAIREICRKAARQIYHKIAEDF